MLKPTNKLAIDAYMHCGRCIEEWKGDAEGTAGTSPASYARLSVGWTSVGLQVWCQRHECNVLHVHFEGQQHPANTTAKKVRDTPGPKEPT